ncbi:hypothetical protein ElyMa_004307100 [Elysia marginata]|uniref:Uncharacterized protein n=1 Tax=Elysia marginata TaxID=1093978 RepID=A0AAV4GYE7_9GAST|nr:hypothetical protein ElyMa_004307100 [Elysia marginata]
MRSASYLLLFSVPLFRFLPPSSEGCLKLVILGAHKFTSPHGKARLINRSFNNTYYSCHVLEAKASADISDDDDVDGYHVGDCHDDDIDDNDDNACGNQDGNCLCRCYIIKKGCGGDDDDDDDDDKDDDDREIMAIMI